MPLDKLFVIDADKLVKEMTNNRCYVVSCECAEHGANSAIYEG